MERLSGDQKGRSAFSVPGKTIGCNASKRRTQSMG
jgi:hypothetical protein